MAVREYRDFVLVADGVKTNSNGEVIEFSVGVFDSPVGQGEQKETVKVPPEVYRMMRMLESTEFDQEVNHQIELGEILAGLLLPEYARNMFAQSLSRCRDDEGVRIRLRLADELTDIPWEYMYIQDTRGERTPNSFLVLDPRISIVRHEALAVPGDWFETPSKRRVLVAMASPQPYEIYRQLSTLPEEQRQLKSALGEVEGVDAVFIPNYGTTSNGSMPGAKLGDLVNQLMQRTDIFHFSGHGEGAAPLAADPNSNEPEGGIVLSDDQNYAVPISAGRFAEVLRGRGIRLVVLASCETGRRNGHNVWSGVAASLLRAGIPAVIAMQYAVQDDLAAAFSGALYRALVAGLTIDEAMALGRAAIRMAAQGGRSNVRDWGVPVLYLRSPGGTVFNPISNKQAVKKAQEEVTQLFEQHVQEVPTEGRVIGPVAEEMKSGSVKVDQKASVLEGFMVGSTVFNIEGGNLTVHQEADKVTGTMIGGYFGQIGGSSSVPTGQQNALEMLDKLLRMQTPPTRGGTTEGPASTTSQQSPTLASSTSSADVLASTVAGGSKPVLPRSQFCRKCGRPLAADAKFCTNCGTQVTQ